MVKTPLPIDSHLPRIRQLLERDRRLVLVAPPGSGKSTRVPPALLGQGAVFLLQPRRVAARSLARRIAEENAWKVGREVGYQVRFEREFGPDTRLLVATEGILTGRLEADPLLSDFGAVLLDEFHERSIHADLALAFLKQAMRARADLRVVVMSATLGAEADRVAAYLEGCAVYEVAGETHPVAVRHLPGRPMPEVVRERLAEPGGHVLCFLPGSRDIREAASALSSGRTLDATVLPLHGGLGAREQDLALAPMAGRKVVLATNIAETSLTIEGVTDVVDSGFRKVQRFDPERGIDRLDLERVSLASAAQRSGRAGRTGPGRSFRLWDERERLRPRNEPDVQRIDLAGALLDVLAWGGDPAHFEWFEAPPAEHLAEAEEVLARLGAVLGSRITPLGRTLRRFPLPPRLARVLVEAGGGARAAACCAVLAERPYPFADDAATDSDVLSRADRLELAPLGVRKAAAEIEALARRVLGKAPPRVDDVTMRRALLAGYPDRVARRRTAGEKRLVLASGHGAVLGPESAVRGAEFLVALDVTAGSAGPVAEARVRMASQVEREWLAPVRREVVHRFDGASGSVRAFELTLYDGLTLGERAVAPESGLASEMLLEELRGRGPGPEGEALLSRCRFAGLALDKEALMRRAVEGRTRLVEVDLARALLPAERATLDRLAPERLPVPSGRSAPLEYRDDGSVVASVKLQELFGLAESPRLGPRREPVTLELLAPNGRPVQTTRDLRGFWDRTYPDVRRELRGRYPKHPWPEDPWTATPTHRTKPRKGGGRA